MTGGATVAGQFPWSCGGPRPSCGTDLPHVLRWPSTRGDAGSWSETASATIGAQKRSDVCRVIGRVAAAVQKTPVPKRTRRQR